MKRHKGFTVVELMAVIAVIAIALVVVLPPGLSGLRDYRFSAACRSFINAVHVAHIQALAGEFVFDITTIQQGTSDAFTLTTGPFQFKFVPTSGHSTPAITDLPITGTDYVTLTGFNKPLGGSPASPYVNLNLFRVTQLPTTLTPPTSVGSNLWQVSSLTFSCKSCPEDDIDESRCLKWGDTTTSYTTTTGKAKVAACVKFVPVTGSVAYSTVKKGNSFECQYDPTKFNVAISVTPDPVATPWVATTHPVVFDVTGATRNGYWYKVEIRKVGSGGPDMVNPPVTITVLPSGRIRLGV